MSVLHHIELEWHEKWCALTRMFSICHRRKTKVTGTRQELMVPQVKNRLSEKEIYPRRWSAWKKSNLLRQSKLYANKGQVFLPNQSCCNQLFALNWALSICDYRSWFLSYRETTKGKKSRNIISYDLCLGLLNGAWLFKYAVYTEFKVHYLISWLMLKHLAKCLMHRKKCICIGTYQLRFKSR